MPTRIRRLHTKTTDGEKTITLEMSRADDVADRANLNTWLSQRARVTVRSVGTSRSSASSRCSTAGATTTGSGRASIKDAVSDLEMSDED